MPSNTPIATDAKVAVVIKIEEQRFRRTLHVADPGPAGDVGERARA